MIEARMNIATLMSLLIIKCDLSHISKLSDRKLLDLFDVFNTFYTQ